jgi:hypothetical protein
MEAGAIVSTVVVWALLIGGLIFCFTRMGKGGGWED